MVEMVIFCAIVTFAGAVWVVHLETDRIVEKLDAILAALRKQQWR
jgi:hypothetical protein